MEVVGWKCYLAIVNTLDKISLVYRSREELHTIDLIIFFPWISLDLSVIFSIICLDINPPV